MAGCYGNYEEDNFYENLLDNYLDECEEKEYYNEVEKTDRRKELEAWYI